MTDHERQIIVDYETRLAELTEAHERVFDVFWRLSPYWHLVDPPAPSNFTRLLTEASKTIERAQARLQRRPKDKGQGDP